MPAISPGSFDHLETYFGLVTSTAVGRLVIRRVSVSSIRPGSTAMVMRTVRAVAAVHERVGAEHQGD